MLEIDELLETATGSDDKIFLLYRRSMDRIDRAIEDSTYKIFGTLSSTASKISNFSGSNRTDPSLWTLGIDRNDENDDKSTF